MRRAFMPVVCLLAATILACDSKKSPTAPSNQTPQQPTTVSLAGFVQAQGGARLNGASVRIIDGPNVNRATSTNSNGEYRFDNLTFGNGNLVATAGGYEEARGGLVIDGTKALNFTLRSTTLWTRSGSGNTVFDMPTYITRVRVIGNYGGYSSNFIIKIGGRLVVNELVGTGWNQVRYEGVHTTIGGVVEITDSSGVAWSLTEER